MHQWTARDSRGDSSEILNWLADDLPPSFGTPPKDSPEIPADPGRSFRPSLANQEDWIPSKWFLRILGPSTDINWRIEVQLWRSLRESRRHGNLKIKSKPIESKVMKGGTAILLLDFLLAQRQLENVNEAKIDDYSTISSAGPFKMALAQKKRPNSIKWKFNGKFHPIKTSITFINPRNLETNVSFVWIHH